jgi:hypothetical protein
VADIVRNRAVNVPSGVRQLTAENVPDALKRLVFQLKRATTTTPSFWPNAATLLNITAFISIDGGPFNQCAKVIGAPGGILIEDGAEQPVWWWHFTLWPGVNRQVRFDVEVVNGPLVSELTLEAFT